jgi:hypothetical protein
MPAILWPFVAFGCFTAYCAVRSKMQRGTFWGFASREFLKRQSAEEQRQQSLFERQTLRAVWAALSTSRRRAWIRMWVFGFVGSVIVIAQIPKPLLFRGAVFTALLLLAAALSVWGVLTGAEPGGGD